MSDPLVRRIREALPGLEIREQEPMRAHTSFRIGGPARVLCLPASSDELRALCELFRQLGEQPVLLGNGSNVLAPDAGIDSPVVVTVRASAVRLAEPTLISAECGVPLTRISALAAEHSLTGMEFAHGIPGTLGGALIMNAGAYGGEMKDVVVATEFLDASLQVREFRGVEHGFAYRSSAFPEGAVILRSTLRLQSGNREEILARCRELTEKRRSSQPLELPSAGSTFKRPVGGFAAKLIDDAGLRGTGIGGARVSTRHAGFIVNEGGATAEDVRRLIALVQEKVEQFSGIRLEPEIRFL